MIEETRRCDNPTCRVEIPATARRYEFSAVLAVIVPERAHERGQMTRELCSQACLLATLSALVKLVDGAAR